MKVNTVTGPTAPTIYNSFDNYHAVPSDYTKVAAYSGVTDSIDGSSVTTTYALYTKSTQMTGTYTGQVKYIMVHPSTANGHTITYNPNGGTVSPASEVVALGTSTTLPTPTYANHIFLGWYTAATGGTKVAEGGDSYSPTDNITLHAHWQYAPGFFAISDMQDMTAEICNNTTTPNASATAFDTDGSHAGDATYVPRTTLTDTRDNTSYLVSKLADGNCWMSQNLELKLTANQAVTAYNWNTDATYSWTPTNTTQTTTGTSWAQDGGNTARSYAYPDNTYYGGTDISQTASATTSGEPYEKAGVLYNWYAATAGTGTSSSTSEVAGSICPKGWRLPANATADTKSFSNLASKYDLPATNTNTGYSKQLQAPLNFNRPGNYNYSGGALNGRGAYGYFWSSVGYSATGANVFGFGSSSFYPQYDNLKGHGFTIRCVND